MNISIEVKERIMPSKELMRLRQLQIENVMPEIGGLLDSWDHIPNDIKEELEQDAPSFVSAISRIRNGMER